MDEGQFARHKERLLRHGYAGLLGPAASVLKG
jgi:hypothetical protein